jgi:hypothetical protein
MKTTLYVSAFTIVSLFSQTNMFAQKVTELYRNQVFSVKSDAVTEGKFTAKVVSENEITSDFQKTSEILKADKIKVKTWKLSKDLTGLPEFTSDIPLANAMHNLSLEEMLLNIRPDSAFMAGKEWQGVWTRDISYSILLSLAMLKPENAKASLMQKVKNGIIIQDTGTGGSYPISTDRMTWALAAYEIYVVTGDKNWLKQAYTILKKTADADVKMLIDKKTMLFFGESSFLDWREQSYPTWMEPKDIYNSVCLGTNAVHYQTYKILGKISEELGIKEEKGVDYAQIAKDIKAGINKYLWNEEKKYYGQYRYGLNFPVLSPRSEGLGAALCVLFDIADAKRGQQVFETTPVLPYGTPCIYPQIGGIDNYHNNAIWSFVQAFWNWSAAKAGNENAVKHGIGALYRQTAMFLTNKENMVAQTGNYEGTVINSDRQLWSVAGNLSTVYRIYFGMDFQPTKLVLNPFIPKSFTGTKTVKNFGYRKAILNITVKGYGNKIKKITLDGKEIKKAEIEGSLTGKHSIDIEMANTDFAPSLMLLTQNKTSPETPQVFRVKNDIVWNSQKDVMNYEIWKNGVKLIPVPNKTSWAIPVEKNYCEYQVKAIDRNGSESFLSEPIPVALVEVPVYVQDKNKSNDVPPNGLLKSQKGHSLELEAKVTVKGKYMLEFLYLNAQGPINTENKCAIRSLKLAGKEIGTVVFPQRGNNNWLDAGYSNPIIVELDANTHTFSLVFEEQNQNMNGAVNTAFVQVGRLRKID